MRTVTFQSVLRGTAQMLGLDVTRDLSSARAASLTEYINNRVKEGWEFDFWPEWTAPEQRQYRPTWVRTTAYAPVAEVAYPTPGGLQYVQALQPSTGQAPFDASGNINGVFWATSAGNYTANPWAANTFYNGGGNGVAGTQVWDPATQQYLQCFVPHLSGAAIDYTKFGVLTPFNRFVAFEQPGQTPIGRVKFISVNNPFIATRNPGKIPFRLSSLGVQVNMHAPAQVWVMFSQREPVFTSTLWSATANYTGRGELVYFSVGTGADGNCYTSSAAGLNLPPATNPAAWTLVPFPLVLANFVKRAALADALRDLKQTDRAVAEENRAYDELSNAQDREIQAQGGSESVQAETYGSGL